MIGLATRKSPRLRENNSYNETIRYFADMILDAEEDYGHEWFSALRERISDAQFPCDKIVLNPWGGYSNSFELRFYYDNKQVLWIEVMADKNNILKINNYSYESKDIREMFHCNIISKLFDDYNNGIVERWYNICNLDNESDDNTIIIEYNKDYKKTSDTKTLKGTISEIFDTYTDMNETLKYCNGYYWSFASKDVERLYRIITSMDNNYFLMSAVRHGRLID